MQFFEHLEPLLKTFWFIAIPASLIFVIQTIMTFIGADGGDGIAPDFDGDLSGDDAPFQLFSFRNLINFLLGLSWTGITFYHLIANKALLIVLSLIIGVIFLYIFFLVIKQVQKLSEDNSFKFSNTLHKTGEVYLAIPEYKKGKGKVLISVNGSFHELDAMTENEKINSGTIVKVVNIVDNSILIVETI